MDEKRAESEEFGKNKINASIYRNNSFKGCPFCGSVSFFQCGVCNKINCKKDNNSVNCAWCNKKISSFTPQDSPEIETGAD